MPSTPPAHSTSPRRARLRRLTALSAWIAFVFSVAMPNAAHAYIDPATTSYLIQVVSGVVITLSVAIGVFFRRIVLWLMTGQARAAASWAALAARRRARQRCYRRRGKHPAAALATASPPTAIAALAATSRASAAPLTAATPVTTTTTEFTATTTTGTEFTTAEFTAPTSPPGVGQAPGAAAPGAGPSPATTTPHPEDNPATGTAPDLRYARSVADVERAARRPVVATGGAAGLGPNGREQRERFPAPPAQPKPDPDAASQAPPKLTRTSWAYLWADGRPFKRRALVATACGLAPAFLLCLFGPLDLFSQNATEFPFGFSELIQPIGLIFLGVSAVFVGILLPLRGRILDAAASLMLGIAFAALIQATFLNGSYGEFNGQPIRWEEYKTLGVVNLALWVVIIAAPLVLRLISRRVWGVVAWLAPTVIMASGTFALLSDYSNPEVELVVTEPDLAELPTYEGVLTVSQTANQYVIVLDMMDQKFVESISAEEPDFFSSQLDGFTEFDNHISNYTRTLPSAVDMLTGERYYFDEPPDQYFARAYRDGDFLPRLRDAGYSTNIYATNRYSYFDISDIRDLADNVRLVKSKVTWTSIIEGVYRLDGFRYAPQMAKPTFWASDLRFARKASGLTLQGPFSNNNFEFHARLKAFDMTVGGAQPRFSFIHLDGAHTPVNMNRDAEHIPNNSGTLEDQARGAFKITFDFLDELRRVGAYEDATIVITADHGHWKDDGDVGALDKPRLTALFVKPAGAAGTPLAHSVAPTQFENVRAFLLEEAGLAEESDPLTVFELPDDASVVRDFFYRDGTNVANGATEHWQVAGEAHDWNNWHFISREPTLYWD
ncbi:MAG: hypothetical protein LBE08_12545 [Bifidobacteriaceae bacterium]|jgi:hypothetical protein|nr:hypothetical protein [Bifidobacteriaceae bacterium]